jgi:hypothetical protein
VIFQRKFDDADGVSAETSAETIFFQSGTPLIFEAPCVSRLFRRIVFVRTYPTSIVTGTQRLVQIGPKRTNMDQMNEYEDKAVELVVLALLVLDRHGDSCRVKMTSDYP